MTITIILKSKPFLIEFYSHRAGKRLCLVGTKKRILPSSSSALAKSGKPIKLNGQDSTSLSFFLPI